MTQEIAFLGLGLMGGPMAANLARQGYRVLAWNRSPDRPGIAIAKQGGAAIASSIAEAVANAEIIFTCVGDVPDIKEVLLGEQGVINYARPHSLIVDMSTIGSNAAKEINTELNKRQLRFMDAPVSGGDIGAIKGTLTIMVGGSPEDFAECKPMLEVMGKNIHLCGAVGNGQGVKMCNQVLAALTMVGLSEAMQLAKHQGLDPNLIVEVCGTGAAGSWALTNLGPKIIESDYEPGFAIAHILKDLRLVQEINQSLSGQIPGVELADRLFKIVQSMDNGSGGKQGTQAMIRAYQEINKTENS